MISTDAATAQTSAPHPVAERIVRALTSEWAFRILVLVAVVQALAIAYTAAFPLVYDETYHFGLVQLFATEGTPFVRDPSKHPGFGDLTHFGSFLYHYLMAGPDALLKAFGASNLTQLLVIRTISVLLNTSALIWFRKTLLFVGLSRAAALVTLAIYISIPLVPSLAATVNYDNLLIPLAAIFFWYGVRAFAAPRFDLRLALPVLASGTLACQASYLFLPVLAIGVIAIIARQLFVLRGTAWRARFEPVTRTDVRSPGFWIVVAFAAIGLFLFISTYIVYLVTLGTPTPDCARFNTIAYCNQYEPWGRNHLLHLQLKAGPQVQSLPGYTTRLWIPLMFQTLNLVGSNHHRNYGTDSMLTLTMAGAVVCLLLLALTFYRLWRQPAVKFLTFCLAAIFVILFGHNFFDYLTLGGPIAVQARYLIFFAPFVIGFAGVGLVHILNRLHVDPIRWKIGFVVAALIFMLQGGGALDYFVSSSATWYLPGGLLTRFAPVFTFIAHKLLIFG